MSISDIFCNNYDGHAHDILPSVSPIEVYFCMDEHARAAYLNELSVHIAKTDAGPLPPIFASFSDNPIADECPIPPLGVREGVAIPRMDEEWIGGCVLNIGDNVGIPVLFYHRDDVLNAFVPNAPLWLMYKQLGDARVLSKMERELYGTWGLKVVDARSIHADIPVNLRRESRERTVIRPLASVAYHMSIATSDAQLEEFRPFHFLDPSTRLKAGVVVFSSQQPLPPVQPLPAPTPLQFFTDGSFGYNSMLLLASSMVFPSEVRPSPLTSPPPNLQLPRWPFANVDCTKYESIFDLRPIYEPLVLHPTPSIPGVERDYLVLVHDTRSRGFRYALDANGASLDFDMVLRTLAYSPPQYILATDSVGLVFSFDKNNTPSGNRRRRCPTDEVYDRARGDSFYVAESSISIGDRLRAHARI